MNTLAKYALAQAGGAAEFLQPDGKSSTQNPGHATSVLKHVVKHIGNLIASNPFGEEHFGNNELHCIDM